MIDLEKEWTTQAGLLACVVFSNNSHRCGYVHVSESSPYFYQSRGNPIIPDVDCLDVHGGVTYEGDGEHLPLSCMPSTGYFVGFDCAHAEDATLYFASGIFRTLDYCIDQCEKLAAQLMLITIES